MHSDISTDGCLRLLVPPDDTGPVHWELRSFGLRADAESWAIYSWQLGRARRECKHCSRTGDAPSVAIPALMCCMVLTWTTRRGDKRLCRCWMHCISHQLCWLQLPRRLARRLLDLQSLPHIVVTNPYISQVYKAYHRAFRILNDVPPISSLEDNRNFTTLLEQLLEEHSKLPLTIHHHHLHHLAHPVCPALNALQRL